MLVTAPEPRTGVNIVLCVSTTCSVILASRVWLVGSENNELASAKDSSPSTAP